MWISRAEANGCDMRVQVRVGGAFGYSEAPRG